MKTASSTHTLTLVLVCLMLAPPVPAQRATETPTASSQTPATSQTPASAQTPVTPQTSSPRSGAAGSDDGDVVRITSNLVQVDAVVTDKKGQQVTDLTADDFELLEDGRPQKITNFSYITNVAPPPPPSSSSPPVVAGAARDKTVPLPPPVHLRPEQVRRTIALVVDDLRASFESVAYVRHALKKFVNEQLQPNDLVAVVRTSAGMSALQQFTSDRQQLHAAVESVKWYSMGRGGISTFAPLGSGSMMPSGSRMSGVPSSFGGIRERGEDRSVADDIDVDEFREEVFAVGTLGALNFIIKGLKDLPGRKSIVLFSDGFRMYDADGMSGRVLQAMRQLTDLANRASVIIYTIDPRGVVYTGLTAADNTSGMTAEQVREVPQSRSAMLRETQSGMDILAQQTGGLAIRNNNDISGGLRRVLDDQKGYYLIGYRPDESTFDPVGGRGKFHKITPKVKRPGLKVRTRGGFYGFTDDETARPIAKRTRNQQLYAALSSPFASGGVPLRLTSLFHGQDEKTSYVDSLLHVDPRSFTFKEGADGWHTSEIDLVALTFGDSGIPVDEVNRTATIRLRGETFQKVLKDGLVYSMRVPVKKPGAYQLRVAVRDTASERVGAASQFIEVPNLKKDRLALSGITIMGSDTMTARLAEAQKAMEGKAAGKAPDSQVSKGQVNDRQVSDGQVNEPDPSGSPAVRRFRRGASVDYLYHIYNAKLDRTARVPQLQTQFRLFRDGQQMHAGPIQPFDVSDQTDKKRLLYWARLRLGTNLPPGEYALQVVVTDMLASEKRRTMTQWVDFEIMK